MSVTGDWVTPRLNAIKYFEKPPLHYWASAAAFSAFGAHEWTARLWSAVTGLLGVLFALFLGRRLFGPIAGEYAAAVLASSLMYVYVAHTNTLDMGLTLFLFVALGAFILAQRDGTTARDNRLWMHVVWAAMALAVLTKGLIGIVLPGISMVLYTLLERDWRLWTRLHIASGSLLFFAIVTPWFVLVSIRNPEFPWFFFVHEHFLRFTTKIHNRDEPWWYFIPLLLAGTLPWVVTVFSATLRSAPRDVRIGFQPRRFLLVWVETSFLHSANHPGPGHAGRMEAHQLAGARPVPTYRTHGRACPRRVGSAAVHPQLRRHASVGNCSFQGLGARGHGGFCGGRGVRTVVLLAKSAVSCGARDRCGRSH
jgi:4-amino-4-deoxy-L-arabinose transferase-like glycosyltransferase